MRKLFAAILVVLFTVSMFSGCSSASKSSMIFSGTVEADEINISPEIAGKIKSIYIEEGQKVKAGTLVASIKSDEGALKLKQSELSVASAQNDLKKVDDGNRHEDIDAQKAMVKQAEAQVMQGNVLLSQAVLTVNTAKTNYDYKLKNYNEEKALYDSGADSKSSLDNSKNILDNAKSTLDGAVSSKDSAEKQLEGFKAQLEAAQQKLRLLVNGQTKTNRNTAVYGVDNAKKNMELSKVNFDKYSIISDVSGVVETVNFKKGEYVSPGSPIITLLDIDNSYLTVYVPEKVLPLIKSGQKVRMTSDFIKNGIGGKITYISPEAEFTPMNIVTKEDREKLVYGVKIKLDDNKGNVRPGMMLDVNLGR